MNAHRAAPTVVYYAPSDLAGLGQRLAMGAIDVVVLALGFIVMGGLLEAVGLDVETRPLLFVLAWMYLAALKATRRGTLGYRVLGFRVVSLDGEAASLLQTTARFLFLHWAGLDTLWVSGDENKQAFRDKFAGTYVVRRDAKPLGPARLSYDTYFILGGSIVMREVCRPPA